MKNKKLLIGVLVMIFAVATLLAVYFGSQADAQEGSKAFTVTVIHADGTEKKFDYRTDETKLGALLEEKGLISSEGADQGMFHTVDGEKADWNVNQSYWAFYIGEDYAMTGIYDTDITDGATYKLVYTIG